MTGLQVAVLGSFHCSICGSPATMIHATSNLFILSSLTETEQLFYCFNVYTGIVIRECLYRHLIIVQFQSG